MAYVAPNTVLALSTLSAATWNQDVVANVIDIESRLPTGAVQMYAGAAAPSNWLLCNGAAVSRTTYSALFAVCSTTYGVGDGSTTFNLPDMRGRVPIGAGTGTGLTARTLGATAGTETHTLSIAEMPSHTHTPNGESQFLTWNGSTLTLLGGGSNATATGSPTTTGSTGTDGAHNNIQPVLALSYIIKT